MTAPVHSASGSLIIGLLIVGIATWIVGYACLYGGA